MEIIGSAISRSLYCDGFCTLNASMSLVVLMTTTLNILAVLINSFMNELEIFIQMRIVQE